MKRLKTTVIATALSASLAAPALANESASIAAPQFSATDMQQLFEQDAVPMQVAALSRTEMKETEGAMDPLTITTLSLTGAGAVGGGIVYLMNTPSSQWSWSSAGRAMASGATAGFYASPIPVAAFGKAGSLVMGSLGAGAWYSPFAMR